LSDSVFGTGSDVWETIYYYLFGEQASGDAANPL